jgi:hypothetical protein
MKKAPLNDHVGGIDKRKAAKAAVASMAAAFGLVAVNPQLRQNEAGEWSLAAGAEPACAASTTEYRCFYNPNYVCQKEDANGVMQYYWSYILLPN